MVLHHQHILNHDRNTTMQEAVVDSEVVHTNSEEDMFHAVESHHILYVVEAVS
jgi:hypothetical protein